MSQPTRSLEFCRRALEQPEKFWAEQAQAIHWQKPFSRVCDFSRPPFARWFVGGETNLCYNAVDRHLASRENQPALHYISTEINAERSFTYRELYNEVCRFSAVLRSLGLKQGDRVIIYLPMIPEAAIAMLASVRLGLVHSVVFAGFAPTSLATRIDGPLIHGMQSVLYEGLPIRPDGGIWWRIVEKYRAAVMFTSPTAIRVLKRQDPEYLHKYDTSSLQRLYLAGEPLDEPTWKWIGDALKIPILDNYWQTETGWPVLALLPGVETPQIRPGSPGIALFGYDAKIVDPVTGDLLARGEKGVLAFGLPLPPGCMSTVWKNDELFEHHYCGRFRGKQLYATFDYATEDEDGYFFILGRSDDVINVSGHRLGTREIEETVSTHPAVAEVATVGAADELKGQSVHCFVVLKRPGDFSSGAAETALKREIEATVVQIPGSFARPAAIYLVRALPKTRSGKILRRAIHAAAEGRDTRDLSTLEDPIALDAIKELLEVTKKQG